MKLINGLHGESTLLQFLLSKLKNDLGNFLAIGIEHLSGDDELIKEFGNGLRHWLGYSRTTSATPAIFQREVYIYIGDWRANSASAISAADTVHGVGALLGILGELRDQVRVLFVPNLHCNFYTMWTRSKSHQDAVHATLEWASIGSSNISIAAMREQNLELDVVFEHGNEAPISFTNDLRIFINELGGQMSDDSELESQLDDIVDTHLDEEQHIREAKKKSDNQRMAQAYAESYRAQEIGPL